VTKPPYNDPCKTLFDLSKSGKRVAIIVILEIPPVPSFKTQKPL